MPIFVGLTVAVVVDVVAPFVGTAMHEGIVVVAVQLRVFAIAVLIIDLRRCAPRDVRGDFLVEAVSMDWRRVRTIVHAGVFDGRHLNRRNIDFATEQTGEQKHTKYNLKNGLHDAYSLQITEGILPSVLLLGYTKKESCQGYNVWKFIFYAFTE